MICFDMVPVRYFRLFVKVEHRSLSLVILGKIAHTSITWWHRLHAGSGVLSFGRGYPIPTDFTPAKYSLTFLTLRFLSGSYVWKTFHDADAIFSGLWVTRAGHNYKRHPMSTIYAKWHTLMFELTHLNILFCVLKHFADQNAFLWHSNCQKWTLMLIHIREGPC